MKAAVVNLGCGLDDTFSKVDNGQCRGYNIDLPDVIRVRDDLLPAGDREINLSFDSCNKRGASLMRKTWLKEAGITDVDAFFSLEDEAELKGWSGRFASVSAKSYMRGYRDIYSRVGLIHKLMIHFCDSLVKMKIVKIIFKA